MLIKKQSKKIPKQNYQTLKQAGKKTQTTVVNRLSKISAYCYSVLGAVHKRGRSSEMNCKNQKAEKKFLSSPCPKYFGSEVIRLPTASDLPSIFQLPCHTVKRNIE